MAPKPKKLLGQVRDAIRLKYYSTRTEEAYVNWIKRCIYFHNVRQPAQTGAPEVEIFLTHLAVEQNVAASTQNQALSALLFLYREVLNQDLSPIDALRAKKPKCLPSVLTREDLRRAFDQPGASADCATYARVRSGQRPWRRPGFRLWGRKCTCGSL